MPSYCLSVNSRMLTSPPLDRGDGGVRFRLRAAEPDVDGVLDHFESEVLEVVSEVRCRGSLPLGVRWEVEHDHDPHDPVSAEH